MTTNRLMIVDDSLIMRMKIKEIASEAGWTVVAEAKNGKEAISLYVQHSPGLVTLDMVMPEMSGSECCAELRRIRPESKILLCTGYDRNHAVQELLNQGVMGFIQKPYDLDALAYVCADALKHHDSTEACFSGSQV